MPKVNLKPPKESKIAPEEFAENARRTYQAGLTQTEDGSYVPPEFFEAGPSSNGAPPSPSPEQALERPARAVIDEREELTPRERRFYDMYIGLWADDPPPGLVKAAASQMNLIEFEANERAKPAFQFSPRFAEEDDMIVTGVPRIAEQR